MSETFQSKATKWVAGAMFAVILSLLGWVVNKTQQHDVKISALEPNTPILTEIVNQIHSNTVSLERLTQKVDDGKENRLAAQALNTEEHKVIRGQIDQMVSRNEFNARVLELQVKIKEVEVQIVSLIVRVAALEGAIRK